MTNRTLPSRSVCYELLRRYHVPDHVVRHSEAACMLGVFLAKRLNERGVSVDVALVEAACLLHDVLRVCDFKLKSTVGLPYPVTEAQIEKWRALKERFRGLRHEDAAYELLAGDYPELAETIRRHGYNAIGTDQSPQSWEAKLVYYADKRVMHDQIVPLRKRLDEAHARYVAWAQRAGINAEEIDRIDALIFELEKEIFAPIGIEPNDVTAEFISHYNDAV